MKKQKIMLIFIAMVVLIMTVIPTVNASSLNIIEDPESSNNANINDANDNIANEPTTENNETANTNNEKNTTDTANNELPQTGVAESSTLFIFIAVCLASAVYAYTKIRNYRSL